MVAKKLTGICAVAMLVVIAAACGCTSTTVESQPAGEPQEDMGAPRANGAASEEREQPQMDYTSAAATLSVTEEELQAALGEPGQGQKTFVDAAATLGVTEKELMEALRVPEGMGEGGMPGGMENGTPPEPR